MYVSSGVINLIYFTLNTFYKENKNREKRYNEVNDFEWAFPSKSFFDTNRDNLYNYKAYDINEKNVSFQKYHGKIILIINVASF